MNKQLHPGFIVNGERWIVSNCGDFVQPPDGVGWLPVRQFKWYIRQDAELAHTAWVQAQNEENN